MSHKPMRPKAGWAIDSEPMRAQRNNCFSKIQLVGQKNIETKHLSLVKFALSRRFSLLVGYNK